MNILLVIIAVVAVVLLLVGGFIAAVKWLLWVGIVLALIAIVVWLLRSIMGKKA